MSVANVATADTGSDTAADTGSDTAHVGRIGTAIHVRVVVIVAIGRTIVPNPIGMFWVSMNLHLWHEQQQQQHNSDNPMLIRNNTQLRNFENYQGA